MGIRHIPVLDCRNTVIARVVVDQHTDGAELLRAFDLNGSQELSAYMLCLEPTFSPRNIPP